MAPVRAALTAGPAASIMLVMITHAEHQLPMPWAVCGSSGASRSAAGVYCSSRGMQGTAAAHQVRSVGLKQPQPSCHLGTDLRSRAAALVRDRSCIQVTKHCARAYDQHTEATRTQY